MRRGAGGVTRSSHHSSGSAANPKSSHGAAKAREPSVSIAYLHACAGASAA